MSGRKMWMQRSTPTLFQAIPFTLKADLTGNSLVKQNEHNTGESLRHISVKIFAASPGSDASNARTLILLNMTHSDAHTGSRYRVCIPDTPRERNLEAFTRVDITNKTVRNIQVVPCKPSTAHRHLQNSIHVRHLCQIHSWLSPKRFFAQ